MVQIQGGAPSMLPLASTSKGFTQRAAVVARDNATPSTLSATVAQRHEAAVQVQVENQQRFAANSKAIEQRALAELQDSLWWVSRLSEGPIDRRLLRQAANSMLPSTYREVMTERHVGGCCAYPPCKSEPRRSYDNDKPVYRLNMRARRVYDVGASTKFCSDDCARRSTWYETVCLASNTPFEHHNQSNMGLVQLLEDIEEGSTPGSSSQSILDTAPAVYPDESGDVDVETDPPEIRISALNDSFSETSNHFLSQLQIVEHQHTQAPHPPVLPHATVELLDLPLSRHGESAILPFDMQHLRREIIAAQGPPPGRDDEDSLLKRVVIDVEPGYEQMMTAGWELFQQLKQSGDIA